MAGGGGQCRGRQVLRADEEPEDIGFADFCKDFGLCTECDRLMMGLEGGGTWFCFNHITVVHQHCQK